MRTISQRELRNDNAAIVRGVEEGEAYTVTRRGVPVARLVPIDHDIDLRRPPGEDTPPVLGAAARQDLHADR